MAGNIRRILREKAPLLVFSSLCLGAASAVYYAHYQQIIEKKTMRQGVINDIKRDRLKQRAMMQQDAATSHERRLNNLENLGTPLWVHFIILEQHFVRPVLTKRLHLGRIDFCTRRRAGHAGSALVLLLVLPRRPRVPFSKKHFFHAGHDLVGQDVRGPRDLARIDTDHELERILEQVIHLKRTPRLERWVRHEALERLKKAFELVHVRELRERQRRRNVHDFQRCQCARYELDRGHGRVKAVGRLDHEIKRCKHELPTRSTSSWSLLLGREREAMEERDLGRQERQERGVLVRAREIQRHPRREPRREQRSRVAVEFHVQVDIRHVACKRGVPLARHEACVVEERLGIHERTREPMRKGQEKRETRRTGRRVVIALPRPSEDPADTLAPVVTHSLLAAIHARFVQRNP
ncbi:hypothetical protein PsorP6_014197 [Peronosclerospora sorghi]|uniref:Uncharacterized protein n=1 Tax=Peronosclerospora sorghi TaxID=230839 RepID=A0ACC0VI17_9STRA|nr:hypothetical protein PsorP6_014197 [Peronosclerospora sorghi]